MALVQPAWAKGARFPAPTEEEKAAMKKAGQTKDRESKRGKKEAK